MSNVTHYIATLILNPDSSSLEAKVRLLYRSTAKSETASFLLHRNLQMEQLTGSELVSYEKREGCDFPFTPEADTWQLRWARPLQPDQTCELQWHYRGALTQPLPWGVNRLSPNWAEIGLYMPWFPWNPHGGLFTYQVEVGLPPRYSLVGTGEVARTDAGLWQLSSLTPVSDISIIAAPNLHQISSQAGGACLRVHHVPGENETGLSSLVADGLWVLEFFQDWFADSGRREVDVVVAPRTEGGGYARPGLIVLSSLADHKPEQRARLLRYIAHEFAHLWWAGADVSTWEDWLNESFAEFSAQKALRARLGEEALAASLARMRARLPGLPPIRGIEREAEEAHPVLYTKGALLLFDLEQLIGEARMTELLRQRLIRHVCSTAGFLSLLGEIADKEAVITFDRWLDRHH